MSRGLNWEKASRRERVAFTPSLRSVPSSQAQLNYITNLCHQKGTRPPHRLPQTMHGASEMIDRLKGLPDAPKVVHEPPKPSERDLSMAELQEHLRLTPQTLRSLFHVLDQIDPLGCALFFDQIAQEELPKDHTELLTHVLRVFVEQYV